MHVAARDQGPEVKNRLHPEAAPLLGLRPGTALPLALLAGMAPGLLVSSAHASWIWMGESTNAPRTHQQVLDYAPADYRIFQGGTVDGENCRSPVGYNVWRQAWESNRELRMENIGTNVIVNPWISNNRHTFRTLQELVDAVAPRSLNERERAYALWDWARKHRYHHPRGYFPEYHYQMYAPLKVFNIYGYDYCEYAAVALGAMWQMAGLPIRWTRIHQHSVREAWFDGDWHMFDSDLHSFMLLPDNFTVASMDDTVADHDLVKRLHHYGIAERHDRQNSEWVAALHVDLYQQKVPAWLDFSMDMALRPGESIAWRWGRDDPPMFHGCGSEILWTEREYSAICQGKWEYAPRFDDGGWRAGTVYAEGLTDADGILRPASPSPGMAIWKMACPYVFVGGALEYVGEKVEFYFSTNRIDWMPAGMNLDVFFPGDGPAVHEYYLACAFTSADAWLAQCKISNAIQMAPLTMPGMQVGENRFTYSDENASRNVRLTHTWVEDSSCAPPPAPASPAYPADGGEAEGTQIAFSWDAAALPGGDPVAGYRFELSDHVEMRWPLSSNFEQLVPAIANSAAAGYKLPYAGLLNPDQEYFWRIRACSTAGVWGAWSPVWSFTPRGPGLPRNVRLEMDAGSGTGRLRWDVPAAGRPPAVYRVYGSDEKGFTISDTPYAVYVGNLTPSRLFSPFPANYIAATTNQFLEVIGPGMNLANGNKTYYRVVAVDRFGNRGGPSEMAEARRPFLCNTNRATMRLGGALACSLQTISSVGHLSSLEPWADILLEYWDIEIPRYTLHDAPSWLTCDPWTGRVGGTPDAAGFYAFQAAAEIENRGAYFQSLTVIVLPTNPPALNNMVGDYDGDGRADAVWPGAAGGQRVWLSSAGFRQAIDLFGGEWNAAAFPAPGDYDGDRRADPAMYDPAAGRWTVLLSGAGYARYNFRCGGWGWQPAPGDYDGDGRTDPCLYQQSTGAWQCFCSGASYRSVQFVCGGPDWQPVPGDYDGDGRTDPAGYNAARSAWQARLSGQDYGALEASLGGPGWTPAPGDYDGDGRTDPVVYHENQGLWQARLSSVNWQAIEFRLGGPGWSPACADYDGDRRMDPVVHNRASGRWLGLLSASDYAAVELKAALFE